MSVAGDKTPSRVKCFHTQCDFVPVNILKMSCCLCPAGIAMERVQIHMWNQYRLSNYKPTSDLSGFTFRINARAVICGQNSHQLTPILRITAQGGFSENSGMSDSMKMKVFLYRSQSGKQHNAILCVLCIRQTF